MPIARLKPSVLFGYVFGRSIEPQFDISKDMLFLEDQFRTIHGIGHRGGPDIAENRNKLVIDFLATSLDAIWMVDTDMAFDLRILHGLLDDLDDTARPIITALAFCRRFEELQFNWFDRLKGGFDGYEPVASVSPGLQPIDACGMACILIHRKALEEIKRAYEPQYGAHAWFGHDFIHGPGGMERLSEDLTFCRRAAHIGIPIWGNGHFVAGHIKPTVEGLATYNRRRAAETAVAKGLVKQGW